MKLSGTRIPGYRIKNGSIVKDTKRLPVNKQIAARQGAKSKVKFVRNPAPKGG